MCFSVTRAIYGVTDFFMFPLDYTIKLVTCDNLQYIMELMSHDTVVSDI